MGGHQREGREAEDLGWRSSSPPCRLRDAAVPSTPEDTSSEAPATRGGGEREGEAEFESASEEREEVRGPDAGRSECFLSVFIFSGGLGGRRPGSPTRMAR